MIQFTWEALVDDFQEDGKPTWAGRLHDIKRRLRQLDIAGATAGAQPVSLADYVSLTADVTAAVLGRHEAPTSSHSTVQRAADDNHFVQRTRSAECLPPAVLP